MPNAHISSFPTPFASPAEQEVAKQQFDRINQELLRNPDPHSSASQYAKRLKHLINPDEITDLLATISLPIAILHC